MGEGGEEESVFAGDSEEELEEMVRIRDWRDRNRSFDTYALAVTRVFVGFFVAAMAGSRPGEVASATAAPIAGDGTD